MICAQSITGLQVGEGGEEEVEVACLAVRGLQALCVQAASKLRPGADPIIYGSPVCTRLEKNSRCPRPRLINSPELQKSQIFIENKRFASLFLDNQGPPSGQSIIRSEWTGQNVEEIGSSVGCLSQVNSAGYFRRLGISPTVTLKTQDPVDESEPNEIQPSYWSPDLESSVQFLFDLFLRWLHFAKVESTETPNHRIIIESIRSLAVLVNFYPSRYHPQAPDYNSYTATWSQRFRSVVVITFA